VPGTDLFLIAEFSADGRLAVTSGLRFPAGPFAPEVRPSEQAPTSLWDLETGAVRTEVSPPQDDPLGLCSPIEGCTFFDGALSPDGARMATVGDDGHLRIWDAADGTALETIELWRNGAPPPGAALGTGVEWTPPDGTKVIALTEDGVVHVFDAETFEPIREFGAEVTRGLLSSLNPEVSPDGSLAAVGYPDGTARVWEIDTGRLVAELPHAGPVSDVGFSSDGSFLVTASGDAPTIWDLQSQRPLTQLFGHTGAVLTVDFSPAGSSIVSGSEDQTVRIWRCEVCAPIDELLDLARERALRDLTPAERARFLHEG
jgi:WD40 repeat protein